MKQCSNLDRVSEIGNYSKNRLILKSFRILNCLILSLLIFSGCTEKEESPHVVIELSEEKLTEFYTGVEDFINSPNFQSCNTIDELKSGLENYLKQQATVEKVETIENLLIITFKGGAKTEIEFLKPIESNPDDFIFEYESETVDASYFTNSTLKSGNAKEQSKAASQSKIRAATADNISISSPNYIYPVFWEPYSLEFSDTFLIDRYYDKTTSHAFHKVKKALYQDAQCDPFSLKSALTTLSSTTKRTPNLIFFVTHGSYELLAIGCCNSMKAYNDIKTKLDGIKMIPTLVEKNLRYYIYLKPDDLKKLLQGADLSNSIVFLNACNSNNYSGSTAFSKVFTGLNAHVFWYSGSIESGNCQKITSKLLACLLTSEHPKEKVPVSTMLAWDYVKNESKIEQANLLELDERGYFKFRHPAQLYEAISYLLMFGLLYCLYLSKRIKIGNGLFFGLSLVLIFTARFLIEFVKERQVEFEKFMKFNMGQLLSLPFVLIGVGFIIYGLSRKRKNCR